MAELDPNIALSGLMINRNDENNKQAQYQAQMIQNRQAQQQGQDQQRLRDLLPQAMQGDQAAMQQVAGLNPDLYMKLDNAQKEAAKAQLADMGSAVRWALSDPNQKAARWNQVVDYYSQRIPSVAQYRDHPEMAETALLKLGELGNYLDGAPNNQATSLQRNYEFLNQKDPNLANRYLQGQALGSPTVVDNGDGTKTIYPPGYFSGGQQGAPQGGSIPPPPPGFVIDGGQTGSAPSGGF